MGSVIGIRNPASMVQNQKARRHEEARWRQLAGPVEIRKIQPSGPERTGVEPDPDERRTGRTPQESTRSMLDLDEGEKAQVMVTISSGYGDQSRANRTCGPHDKGRDIPAPALSELNNVTTAAQAGNQPAPTPQLESCVSFENTRSTISTAN